MYENIIQVQIHTQFTGSVNTELSGNVCKPGMESVTCVYTICYAEKCRILVVVTMYIVVIIFIIVAVVVIIE